jgi:hypothetical protein
MAFVKPTINKISTDMKDLTIYIRTIKKWGKSTLFRDTIIEKYGDPSYGLSVSCGKEKGEKLLDNLNKTKIDTYKDAIEMKKWLIEQKGKEHNIEIIAFDTVDELVPIFEKETIRISNIEEPQKKVSTINAAMGGYQSGQAYTADLIKSYVDDLTEAGFGVWAIAHTKFKTIKEKGGLEEDGYMQLTSNLVSAYEAAFGDIFDVTLTGVIDRNVDIIEKKVGKETKEKRYATDSIRKLYFRGTTLIDAGGRFADGAVPEYMVFDKPNMAGDFIKTIQEGMEKSKTVLSISKTNSKSKIKNEPKNEPVEKLEDIDNSDNDIDELDINADVIDVKNLVEDIRKKFKDCTNKETKDEIKLILADNGGKLSENIPHDVLKDILTKLS